MGKDHTIYSLIDGVVKFEIKDKKKKFQFTQHHNSEYICFFKGCMALPYTFFYSNIK